MNGTSKYLLGGIDLAALSSEAGSFTTLLLGPCRSCEGRARIALDNVPVPAPNSGLALAGVQDNRETSQVIVVTPSGDVRSFEIDEPLHADVARHGSVPSLGVLIESAQTTAPHVVVVVDDDVYAITGFGLIDAPGVTPEPTIKEALLDAIDLTAAMEPWMVALVGPADELADVGPMFSEAMPNVRLEQFTEAGAKGLDDVADEIVTRAASLAADWVTEELEHWRAAAAKSYTVEGVDVINAVLTGAARRVFVHDDRNDRRTVDDTRLIDIAVAETIKAGLPLVMLPRVDPTRGPADSLGAIVPPPGQ